MKKIQFTMKETGHESIMSRPAQASMIEYKSLKAKYLKILEKRRLLFEIDRIDNRRTIACVKANKLTADQLNSLIEINNINKELHSNLKINDLKQFFSDRPQLTPYGFAKEAGVSPRLLDYILKDERSLTEKTWKKLLPVMKTYGFKVTG